MANSPSKAVLIAGAVMAVGAMVVLNTMSQKMTPKSEEEQEREQQQSQAQQTPPPAAPKTAGAARTAAPRHLDESGGPHDKGTASSLVALGPDKTIGASGPGPDINIRYSWTPAVQSDPKKVYDAVAAVKSAVPNAHIHVTNTDETPGVADGVFLGDKQIAPAQSDGSISVTASAVQSAVGGVKK